jgi:hypothetical protein
MYSPKRLAATLVAGATLAAAGPAVASAATLPTPTDPAHPKLCFSGIKDPGPLGANGPYGPMGPYGQDGPLHGTANPLGDVATCGGLLTYILRGGTLSTFVQANLEAAGH